MRLLVTGGSGFTGRHLLRAALGAGHEVTAVVRSAAAARTVEALGATAVPGDLDDPASLDAAFATPADALLNIASLGFGHAPAIVAAAEDGGLRRAVFVSTTAVTTALPAPSKRVRLAAEETIRRSALDWTILRPTMIYGAAGDRNLSRLLSVLRRTPVLPLPGGGNRLQQPVHVEDLSAALLSAVSTERSVGRTYTIAGPDPLPFRELVQQSGRAVGRAPRLVSIPLRPTIALLRLYEQAAPHPRLKAEQLERLAEDKAFTIDEAARDFGYAPRPFADGIAAEAAALGR